MAGGLQSDHCKRDPGRVISKQSLHDLATLGTVEDPRPGIHTSEVKEDFLTHAMVKFSFVF